jgi:hypothetical protein
MATSDKWRLYISANNGDATLVDIADIQFRTAVGVPRYFDVTGTWYDVVSAASSDASHINSLFDGDASYSWRPNISGGAWVEIDYAAPITIVSYAVRVGYASEATKRPKDFVLQYWDGAAWVTADTQTNQTSWGNFSTREYTVGTPGYVSRTGMIIESSTKWRINVTAVNGATKIGIDDFQLHNRAYIGSDIHQQDMEPYPNAYAASSTEAGTAASNVTDFTTAAWKSNGTTTGWVEIDFPWVFEPVEYKIVGTSSTETPRDWTLEYWDGAAWVVADTRTGITATSGLYTITPSTGLAATIRAIMRRLRQRR